MTQAQKEKRVACISASRMASWFDDIQRERAQKDGGRSLEWVPGAIASVCDASERAELVAVCDLKPELLTKIQERWHVPAVYTDWREMVERERPDVVAIVTMYGSVHAELAAAVAETGLVRGIYCEKPVAASMIQADRVVAACREHNVVYTCAHVFRWNARYRQAITWIRDGAIGEVRSVSVTAMGTLLHSGTHQIDAINGLAGDADPEWAMGIIDVLSDAPQDQWARPDPVGGGYARLTNGVDLLMDPRSPGPRTFQVNGTFGKIIQMNDLRQVQLWRRGSGPTVLDLQPGPLLSPMPEKSYALTQMEELLDVMERGGATSCNEVHASRALEIALGLHLSHRQNGTRIPFPLQDRSFSVDTK